MNYIDNGVSEVVSVTRIVTEDTLGFSVTFKDYYSSIHTVLVSTLKEVEQYQILKRLGENRYDTQ